MSGGFQPLRRRRAQDVASLHFGPNMTPMVDVVMVILVFFMVSAAFLGPEWLLSSLVPQLGDPAAAKAKATPGSGPRNPNDDPFETPPVRFVIELERRAEASGTNMTVVAHGAGLRDATIEQVIDALNVLVKDAGGNVEVLVKPGAGVPWGPVVRAHELCNAAGISRVGPSTKTR